jgi:hypothetical protein
MQLNEIKAGDRLMVRRNGETVPVEVVELSPETNSFWIQIAQDTWAMVKVSAVVGRAAAAALWPGGESTVVW